LTEVQALVIAPFRMLKLISTFPKHIGLFVNAACMLPDLKKNADGAVELYVRKDKPIDSDEKASWLPAPDGPFLLVMRLYWPKEAALRGTWKPTAVTKADVNWDRRERAIVCWLDKLAASTNRLSEFCVEFEKKFIFKTIY
jgi:hypothetical protein